MSTAAARYAHSELQRAGFVIECCERTSGIRAVGPPKSYVLVSARRAHEPAVQLARP